MFSISYLSSMRTFKIFTPATEDASANMQILKEQITRLFNCRHHKLVILIDHQTKLLNIFFLYKSMKKGWQEILLITS